MISNCGSSEAGGRNGKVGDQTGKEYRIRTWYKRDDFVCILRYPDSRARALIADYAKRAANNDHIGYGQSNRLGMYQHCATSNWDPGKITVDCNSDCSASTCAVVICVGHQLSIPRLQKISPSLTTYTMKGPFIAAGFEVLTGDKYKNSEAYLVPGDIVLCKEHVYIEVGPAGVATKPATGGKVVKQYAGIVTLSNPNDFLNVRKGAGTNFANVQVGGDPFKLPPGMVISIERESNGWGKLTGVNGWVSLKYIQR